MSKSRRKPRSDRTLTPVEDFDLEVAEAVHVRPQRKLGRWLAAFAELGDQPPLLALSGGVAALGLVRRDRRMVRAGFRMIAAHAVATAVKGLVKDRVDRTRPGVALRNERYRMTKGDSREGQMRSMPSGHSAGLAAVVQAARREYPETTIPMALAGGSVALAQMPSGNHFVSDVLAGVGIGVAAEAAVAVLMGPPQDA